MMKIFIICLVIILHSNLSFSQYQIKADILGNGGGKVSNSDFNLTSTLGQTCIGEIDGDNYNIQNGFWVEVPFIVTVENDASLNPSVFKMYQNYPNPFNPSTIIEYQIPEVSHIILKVYDILGRETTVLVNGENSAGNYKVNFNANDLASGIYFYKLDAKSKVSNKQYSKVGKMILMK